MKVVSTPHFTEVKISSLNVAQLIKMLEDRKIPIKFPVSRQTLEDLMKLTVNGRDSVVIMNVGKSRKELERDVLEDVGSDEYPWVKQVNISSLRVKQLIEVLEDKNVSIKYPVSRETLEDSLRTVCGTDKLVTIDVLKINSMSDYQLEEIAYTFYKTKRTIRQCQQELAQSFGHLDNNVTWDV